MMKLVIFDLDDTIVHLAVDWKEVKKDIISLARKEGISIDPDQHIIPLSNAVAAAGMKSKVDEIYRKHEAGSVAGKTYAVYPEMIALVRELRNKGVLLGIASGNHGRNIGEILRHLGLGSHFDCIMGRDRAQRNKPDPEQLKAIMGKTRIGRRFTIFIGDSESDALAAKAAGVSFFRVEKGGTKDTAELRRAIGLLEGGKDGAPVRPKR